MCVKIFFYAAALTALPLFLCEAAPGYNNTPVRTPQPTEEMQSAMRQVRSTFSEIKNELNNHEVEIRAFENRLHTQETMMETIREQLTNSVETQNELSKTQIVHLECRTNTLDETLKALVTDMRQMRGQSNELVTITTQYKLKLAEFEKLMEAQNRHMKSLETALNAMMEVLQAKSTSEKGFRAEESPGTYKVQSGDSLEKIARLHKVSVQAIRDLNSLNNDRIVIGQTLIVPLKPLKTP
jgi:LysM repeat protein